ncbi:right-handed parallel beta-helix repeat-containing protein [Aeoliella mucimassa]|uniref:Right handed beta helix domain-containing protein n=1 Tax=Aeoliella mucimassa TaxID=2527972 RepID=A0A518AVW5_9BACT|nr:right-handed parallel beta-helix repeat-containing protein [Aeoliella mucimassa]QDU58887.1 hypothetical protein Pan181_51270 [Aeoliella mucimassa]
MLKQWIMAYLCVIGAAYGADFHATPTGAGLQDGSDWSNALGKDSLSTVFNEVMQPGDRLLLGSGVYSAAKLNLKVGGEPPAPKVIAGVDRGEGLPCLRGSWSIESPAEGATAIRIDAGVSNVTLTDLRIERFKMGVHVPSSKGLKKSSQLVFRNIDMQWMRHGFYLAGCTNTTLKGCDLSRYSKHGFRFEEGCSHIQLLECTADCSTGDAEWEKQTELFPFGFIVNQSSEQQTDFLFQDCLAQNNRMPLQDRKYKNGDGFVVEKTTTNVEFVRCRAIRNQDGGFDLKPRGIKLRDCVAVDNSRQYRLWDDGTLTNCFAGRGTVGLWNNGGSVVVTDSTFFGLTDAAVLTDDHADGGVVLQNCIVASCNRVARHTAHGKTEQRETLVADSPNANGVVSFVGDEEKTWTGLTNAMNARSHPDKGYRYIGRRVGDTGE